MPTVTTLTAHGQTTHTVSITATVVDEPSLRITAGNNPAYELRDRVYAALANSGLPIRTGGIEIHLPDHDTQHPEAAAVAVAIIAATIDIDPSRLACTAVVGELNLNGTLRHSPDVHPAARIAAAHGIRRMIVPTASITAHDLAGDIDLLGAQTLADIVNWLRGDNTALHPGDTAARASAHTYQTVRVTIRNAIASGPVQQSKARWLRRRGSGFAEQFTDLAAAQQFAIAHAHFFNNTDVQVDYLAGFHVTTETMPAHQGSWTSPMVSAEVTYSIWRPAPGWSTDAADTLLREHVHQTAGPRCPR